RSDRPHPRHPPFPYTTLFRSPAGGRQRGRRDHEILPGLVEQTWGRTARRRSRGPSRPLPAGTRRLHTVAPDGHLPSVRPETGSDDLRGAPVTVPERAPLGAALALLLAVVSLTGDRKSVV